MEFPLVSCIMPTANRQKYIPLALNYFMRQDYPNTELVIIDDGITSSRDLIPDDPRIRYFYSAPLGTIGLKRNYACEISKGEIIVHWDDDDWYADDWVSRQVKALNASGADITGLNNVVFYSPALNKRWRYEDTETDKPWICGATMAYKKSFWEQHRFPDLQVGEDYDFVWNSGAKTFALGYLEGFIALLHQHNTSIKPVENPKHKKNPVGWEGAAAENAES
ncbi:glycosyltransferase family A protein [Mucilaginibacter sp. UR6-11]|uniref:glycosyltransferase family 2 protein n=1 Tax=Mucilaginibacter sp. UR6-11 TaxID=1435644 RepID=UPI001E5B14E3|nr:glycosyltransferase family A protein [Mucilaginibacter sp. UR6-11]MCC8423671.1 glycosyltransferase family 2 protein [Mucilaginibacter sp. UR6-11]